MTVPDPTERPLTLRLFGPFEVQVNGAPLPRLRSRKGLWLLALLALRQGSEVERDWLAGTLWPESTDGLAAHSLRVCLADLRRALGPEADRLRSPSLHALSLDLSGAQIDVVAFDQAIARGDEASLEEAISLYRGPLLEGCVEEWAFQERQAREQAYLTALETLAARVQERGDRGAAERYLRRAVAVDPQRETAQRSLMQTLAEAGNYSAALTTYRDLRLRLHHEMNAEPDPETTALFQRLRAEARQKAEGGARLREQAPEARREALTRHDRLLETAMAAPNGHVFVTSGLRQQFPPLWSVDARPHNLPAPPTPLLGRERELEALQSLLRRAEVRLVTLTGPGGTGKTRLAFQVAAALLDDFLDGAFFVDLAPISDPGLVTSAIAQTLGVRDIGSRPLLDSLKGSLREKQLLLLLDNFEPVLAAAPLVADLLAAAPCVKVLVTSRTVLHLRGEKAFPVPPLAVPPVANGQWLMVDGPTGSKTGRSRSEPSTPLASRVPDHQPSTISQYAAVELFIARALDAQPDFVVTNENAPAVAEICRRLDGLPLAIELAAAWIRLLSPQAMLARLVGAGLAPDQGGRPQESPLQLLTEGARDLPARQRTLRSAIGWSYDLLDPAEQKLFRRLSVFVGGSTLEAAEAVGGSGLDEIAALMDQSLLRLSGEADSEARFWMLETIREYAREQLEASGEAEAARRQHRDWYLALAEQAEQGLYGERETEWLDRLEREHDNLRAALAWTRAQGQGEAGLRLGGILWQFWYPRGYYTEGREQLAALLALPGAGARTLGRAQALHGAGMLAMNQGEYREARALLEESLAISREAGHKQGAGWSLGYLGMIARDQGDLEAARALLEEALTLFRELGRQEFIAWSIQHLAIVSWVQKKYGAARALFEESLARYREIGHQRGISASVNGLGMVALSLGEYGTARGLLAECLAISWEAGHSGGLVRDLEGLAVLAMTDAQTERAVRLFGALDGLREAIGQPRTPAERTDYDRSITAARAGLGEAAFDAAWAEGRAMPLEQAMALALEEGAGG